MQKKKHLFDILSCTVNNFDKILIFFPTRKNSPFAKIHCLDGTSLTPLLSALETSHLLGRHQRPPICLEDVREVAGVCGGGGGAEGY